MTYQHNIQGCFSSDIGPHAVCESTLESYRSPLQETLIKFQDVYEKGSLPHFKIPFLRKDLLEATSLMTRFRDEFADVIILGTGGSSLGGQMITSLANQKTPRLHFVDNIDPHTFEILLESLKPEQTGVVVISKSGSTAETILQCLSCLEYWRTQLVEQSWAHHFLVITEKKSSPLFRLKDRFNLSFLEHDPDLGGRFSIFSLVGLFPAMLVGIDPIDFREGAASVITELVACREALDFAPAVGAALNHVFFKEKQMNMAVFMPYCDRLQFFSKWYRQLWAESLGKDGKGTTPIDALGAVDQHSQLQLYLDGPRDKFFTVLTTNYETMGPDSLPSSLINDVDLEYLYGKRLGDLMMAEQDATIQTLIQNHCPTRVIHVPEITPYSLGALAMHFVFETLFASELFWVDPFNQPAVEQGKILAKKYLLERSS
jgi:glucose-6-phosphate isomerase